MRSVIGGILVGLVLAILIAWTVAGVRYVRSHPHVMECKAEVMT